MGELKLTEQQHAAVFDRGGSLLVSAAAGSGKTKVLVERVFSYLTQEHANVDDFLIIYIFHFTVQTLNLRTFYYRCQQSFSICTTDTTRYRTAFAQCISYTETYH